MVAALTLKEQIRAEAYEAMTARQLAEDSKHIDLSPPSISELYRTMETEDLAAIRELHRDIGALRAVKERWPEDDWIRQMTDYLIRTDLYQIENLMEDIRHGRNRSEELERI